MRVSAATFAGLVALAAVSVQAVPSPTKEDWLPLRAPLSLGLGDQGWGEGWHRPLWRDTRREGWWGACVPNWR